VTHTFHSSYAVWEDHSSGQPSIKMTLSQKWPKQKSPGVWLKR
jgi:hypothetical protein